MEKRKNILLTTFMTTNNFTLLTYIALTLQKLYCKCCS